MPVPELLVLRPVAPMLASKARSGANYMRLCPRATYDQLQVNVAYELAEMFGTS